MDVVKVVPGTPGAPPPSRPPGPAAGGGSAGSGSATGGVRPGGIGSRCAALVLGAALLALAGCYWSKYEKLARTHAELLLAMAAKVADVTAAEGSPPSLGEYRYPLERARDFARIAARRFEGSASLTAFRAMCDAYEHVLAAVERLRVDPGGAEPRAALAGALAAFRARTATVLATLDAESGAPRG